MKVNNCLIVSVVLGLTFLSLTASSQDPNSSKPLYRPTGEEGTVTGTITFAGRLPKRQKIDMSADPVCVELNPNPFFRWAKVNEDKLQDVLLYVKDGEPLKTYRFDEPDNEVVLEHARCQYSPHLVAMRVGQKLVVKNLDPTTHNTHPVPKMNAEWNQSQPANVEPFEMVFSRAEAPIPFKDNQHPWEHAFVGVFSHPFFAISDEQGSFRISGLPPGTYKLVAWHDRLPEQETEFTLKPRENRQLDFLFTLDEPKN